MMATAEPSCRITVVFDNIAYDERLTTSWGYAAVVECGGGTVLFDTGGQGGILVENLQTLAYDPATLEHIVISHAHQDHYGGVAALAAAGAQASLYVFPQVENSLAGVALGDLTSVQVEAGMQLVPGIATTGVVGSAIPEQALIVETSRGLVVITGCAHPGVVELVRAATSLVEGEVYLVMGGFHLGQASDAVIRRTIADFQALGVQHVAPSHCTGDRALDLFEEAYGDHFLRSGVGMVILITPGT